MRKNKRKQDETEREDITVESGKKIRKVTIVGMGALGLMYGKRIADSCGREALSYVMDEARAEKNRGRQVICNGVPEVFPIEKDTEASPADLVMVAVKYTGLEAAMETMKWCVGPETIIMSVMNGISTEEILGERFGRQHMIYTVAQGMDAMKFGNTLQYSRYGALHIGITETGRQENLDRLIAFFEEIGMPYVKEEDILYRIWSKFMLNVGINQTCMVYGVPYGVALTEGTEENRTLIAAMREVIAVGNAEGIALTEKDLNQYIGILRTLDPDNTPSMGQDRINQKPSEVELFAGTVIRLAEKHQIYVPANRFLYRRVKEIEREYGSAVSC